MSPVSLQKRLVRTIWRPYAMFGGLVWLASMGVGCFKPDDGREPPLDRIYFPTGLALSPDGDRLYVANSDWDLQFNAGSVQVYDAARLREQLPTHCESDADCSAAGGRCDLVPTADASGVERAPTHWCLDAQDDPCGGLGLQTPAQRTTAPGLCAPIENRAPGLLLGSVRVGAFATDLIYRANPAGGGRLFVPVRSDATLHWMDVVAGGVELDCGQGASGECDANHRRGDDPGEASAAGDELPIEPYGIDASEDGTAIVVTHQTEGRVSLFSNDWEQPQDGPRLSYILDGLAATPVLVTAVPVPEIAKRDRASARALGYRPGFWVGFRGQPFIQLLRYVDAVDSPDDVPFIETAFADRLTTTEFSNIRGLAVDASARSACEDGCGDDLACLEVCAGVALDVYLSNTLPASLLVGHSTSIRRASVPNDRLLVTDAIAIDDGPSRTVVGQITDERGERQRRVFVTSFDARSVTIYDPTARVIEARVATGRGPTALAVDPDNAIAYVAHFTDSYIGIIDLDRRHATYGTIVRALGRATPPRGDE